MSVFAVEGGEAVGMAAPGVEETLRGCAVFAERAASNPRSENASSISAPLPPARTQLALQLQLSYLTKRVSAPEAYVSLSGRVPQSVQSVPYAQQ